MKKIYLIWLALLSCASLNAAATDIFVEGGLHLGGDTLASASSSSGSDQKLKAGQLISLALGMHTDLSDSVQGRVSLGYKFDEINADNGDASFTRMPFEALVMKQSGNFMFGGGIAYHLSPEYEFNVSPTNFKIEFEDALGFVLAFDYNSKGIFEGDWYLGGRITLIDYEATGLSALNGNSFGAIIGYMW